MLLALFSAFALVAQAQFLLGGQFNFSSIKDKEEGGIEDSEETITNITVMPRLAYVNSDMWYGIDGGVTLIKDKFEAGGQSSETKSTLASVAPFFRWVKRPVDNLGLWVEVQAGASFGSEEDEDGNKTAELSGFGVGVRPGVILFVGQHLSFEASFGRLGYRSVTMKNPDDSNDKETISQFGLMLNDNSLTLNDALLNVSGGFTFGANWMF